VRPRFDKTYDEIRGRLSFGETHVPEMLRLGRSRVALTVETLMMIDSLDMTAGIARRIVTRCVRVRRARDRGHARNGHDGRTARRARRGRDGEDGGADRRDDPYAFGSSDGRSTLAAHCRSQQVLPTGVYIAMNGQCFPWDRVRKNKEAGVFESCRSGSEPDTTRAPTPTPNLQFPISTQNALWEFGSWELEVDKGQSIVLDVRRVKEVVIGRWLVTASRARMRSAQVPDLVSRMCEASLRRVMVNRAAWIVNVIH
jgi:L-asparaginase